MKIICVYVLEMNKAFSTFLYQFLVNLSKFTNKKQKKNEVNNTKKYM